jgi:hypothetical protein
MLDFDALLPAPLPQELGGSYAGRGRTRSWARSAAYANAAWNVRHRERGIALDDLLRGQPVGQAARRATASWGGVLCRPGLRFRVSGSEREVRAARLRS